MEVSSSTSTTLVSSDPVSSLRAAALSTLKSKRRKAAAVEKPAPASLRPPPPTDSFQLDYGQEDNNQDVTKSDVAPPVSEVPETKEKSPIPTADVHMREEGEISDEEGPPTLPMQTDDHARKSTKSSVPSKSVTPENIIHNFLEARPTPPPLSPSPRSLTPEIQKLAARNLLQSQYSLSPLHQHQPTLMDRLSVPETFVPAFKQEEEIFDIPMLDTSEQYAADIGPDCVRPGLYLNQEDYDTVKDIILDLLGWGVPFEFLVDCGISKEVIYYVFNELELRLPDEFDTSGMIPYTAETIAQLQQTVLMPPPLPAQQRRDSIESSVSVKMDTSVKVVTPPAPPVTVSDAPSSVVESPQNTDLHDMERQRRQELLARKAAVQASRRQKQHVPSKPSVDILQPSDSMVVDHDNVEMAPYAATETVEDFLNSLSAVQGLEPTSKAIVTPETESIPMNVDQQDQSSHEQTVELKERDQLESGLNSAVSEQFSVSSNHSLPFTDAPPSSTEPPPTSVGSSNSNFSYFSSSTPPTPVDILPRRGSKRPVAADFVDFDPAPKRHEHTSQIERMNGTGSITRRLTTGTTFQNINSRRCVIDLSDSEDDEDEPRQQSQPREDPIQQRRDKHAQLPRQFPSPAPIKSVPSGTLSPAALQLKELEIRKMRELIAKREEETRLRKLALARSASTTNVQNSVASTPITSHAPLKVEEVDVLISASAATPEQNRDTSHNLRSSESATPPVDTEHNAQPPNGMFLC